MSATNFKVGDIVRLSDVGKKQYQDAKYNPYDLTGVITKINSIIVKWSNGEANSYDPKDIELVEPKQEQYYTEKPTDVKVGDMFEVISFIDYDGFLWSGSSIEIGDIVRVVNDLGSNAPRVERISDSYRKYMGWGCLKPVKEDINYNVDDWVLLVNKRPNNWNPCGLMDKYLGTIQQIKSRNFEFNTFNLVNCEHVDGGDWLFTKDNFVKKVDAPVVTNSNIPDIPPSFLSGRDSLSTDAQQFSIGDEVELIEDYGMWNVGQRCTIRDFGSSSIVHILVGADKGSVYSHRLKLINNKTTNNNGKVQNNSSESIIFSPIIATITTGSTPRGIVICSTRKKITLGD